MVGSVLGTRESEAPLPAEDFLLIVACGYFLVLAPPPPTYWIYIHNITQPDLSPAECSLLFCSIQQICFMETVTKKKGLWNPTHKEDEDTDIHSHK